MRRAGIRLARQNLSVLIDEVKKGAEILITDRGRPVARLSPPRPAAARRFPGCAAFRRTMPRTTPPVSEAVGEDREDRF